MKKSIAFVFLLTVFACKTTPGKKDVNVKTNLLDIVTEKVVEAEPKAISNLVFIKKDACSGDCPEFEVAITKDSILNYNGLKNVATVGKHQLKLTSAQFLKLEKTLSAAKTDNLSTSYVDDTKLFLPITNISIDERIIKINLWKDAPESLINVYTFIEDLLYDQKYLEE